MLTPFLSNRTRFSVGTLPADWMILPRMDEQVLIRAAYITLFRVSLERFPPGAERRAWLRWLRARQAERSCLLKSNGRPAGREH
jgi:hypothetical protein